MKTVFGVFAGPLRLALLEPGEPDFVARGTGRDRIPQTLDRESPTGAIVAACNQSARPLLVNVVPRITPRSSSIPG